jgi:hypothetical protein
VTPGLSSSAMTPIEITKAVTSPAVIQLEAGVNFFNASFTFLFSSFARVTVLFRLTHFSRKALTANTVHNSCQF